MAEKFLCSIGSAVLKSAAQKWQNKPNFSFLQWTQQTALKFVSQYKKKFPFCCVYFNFKEKVCYDTNNNGGRSDMTCWFGTALSLSPVASFSLVSPLTYDRLMKLRLSKIQWNSLDKEGLHFKRHSHSSYTIRKKNNKKTFVRIFTFSIR